MSETAVLAAIRRVVREEGTQRNAACYFGVSAAFLSMVLRGKKAPGPKILRALGYRKTYEKQP